MDEISKIDENVVNSEITRLVREIKAVRDELDELTELEETLKSELIDRFKSENIDNYEGAGVTVDLVEAKIENRLDTKRLKEEDPDLYQKYLHPVERREHLRFRKTD
ncbi:hypothetical protein [Methanolapillus millepedarum]